MTDRLAELRGPDYQDAEEEGPDVEQGMSPEFDQFSRELAVIEKAIRKIQTTADELTHPTPAPTPTPPSELLDDADRKCAAVRKRLHRIADENRAFAASSPPRPSETKVRVNRHQAVTRAFLAAAEALERAQSRVLEDAQKDVARSVREVNPGATEGEIRAAVSERDLGRVLEEKAVVEKWGAGRERMREVEAKNEEIVKMEKSVEKLHQMFVDLSLLVENQGELLNEVEYNTKQTVEKVEEAETEVVRARKYQISARKKAFWIIAVLVVIVLIIVLSVVFSRT